MGTADLLVHNHTIKAVIPAENTGLSPARVERVEATLIVHPRPGDDEVVEDIVIELTTEEGPVISGGGHEPLGVVWDDSLEQFLEARRELGGHFACEIFVKVVYTDVFGVVCTVAARFVGDRFVAKVDPRRREGTLGGHTIALVVGSDP
tara:strand:+ start:1564 stop:2010 length:447 start_codon:yes stop_codon:yes gene_type:complete